jgi:hypothetical protein
MLEHEQIHEPIRLTPPVAVARALGYDARLRGV